MNGSAKMLDLQQFLLEHNFLFSPLTESSQSLRCFQTRQGRSPQEIRRAINDNQGKVSLVTKLLRDQQKSDLRMMMLATLRFWLAEALALRCCKHDSL